MSDLEKSEAIRADPKSHEGFIARAFDTGGLKAAVREAKRLFDGYEDREILKAAESMQSKVRTAIVKMVNLR